jgi:hypothetical protein
MKEPLSPNVPSRTVRYEISHRFGSLNDPGVLILWAEQHLVRAPVSPASRQKVWETTGWAWGWRTQYDGRIDEQSQAGQSVSLTGCLRALEYALMDRFVPPVNETQRVVHLLLLCIVEHVTHFFNTDALLDDDPAMVDTSPAVEEDEPTA